MFGPIHVVFFYHGFASNVSTAHSKYFTNNTGDAIEANRNQFIEIIGDFAELGKKKFIIK